MTKAKFEYQTRYFGSHEMDDLRMKPFLNEQGQNGWELVQIITMPFIDEPWRIANYTFIFKRKL